MSDNTIVWNTFSGGLLRNHGREYTPRVGAGDQFSSAHNIWVNESYGVRSAPMLIGMNDVQAQNLRYVKKLYASKEIGRIFEIQVDNNTSYVYRWNGTAFVQIPQFNYFNHAITYPVEQYDLSGGFIAYNKHYVFSGNNMYVFDEDFATILHTIPHTLDGIMASEYIAGEVLVATRGGIYSINTVTNTISASPVITTIPKGHRVRYMYYSNDVLNVVVEGGGVVDIYQFQYSDSGSYEITYKTTIHTKHVVACTGNNSILYILDSFGRLHSVVGYQTQEIYRFFNIDYLSRCFLDFYEGELYLITQNTIYRIRLSDRVQVVPIYYIHTIRDYSNGVIAGEYEYKRTPHPSNPSNFIIHKIEGMFQLLYNVGHTDYSSITSNDFFANYSDTKKLDAIEIYYNLDYSIGFRPNTAAGNYTRPMQIEVYLNFWPLDKTYEDLENGVLNASNMNTQKSVLIATITDPRTTKKRISAEEIREALQNAGYSNTFTSFSLTIKMVNGGTRGFVNYRDKHEEIWMSSPVFYEAKIHYTTINHARY